MNITKNELWVAKRLRSYNPAIFKNLRTVDLVRITRMPKQKGEMVFALDGRTTILNNIRIGKVVSRRGDEIAVRVKDVAIEVEYYPSNYLLNVKEVERLRNEKHIRVKKYGYPY